jgi:hypothetical protein
VGSKSNEAKQQLLASACSGPLVVAGIDAVTGLEPITEAKISFSAIGSHKSADPPSGAQWTASLTPQQKLTTAVRVQITRGYKRRKIDTTTFTGANKTLSFEFSGGGEGRGTNLDEIALLIANKR